MYENAALLDKPVIDVVASIAEKHAVPRAHVAIAWLLSKSVITAPIIGATKPEHLSTAISALDFSLSDAEITELEARYLPHPLTGSFPRFRIRRLPSRRLQRSRTVNTLPWPGVAGSPRPLIPGH